MYDEVYLLQDLKERESACFTCDLKAGVSKGIEGLENDIPGHSHTEWAGDVWRTVDL